MPRNTEKYAYLELALLRESPLWKALQADAAASGKPVAQVAAQRLADYYRAGSRSLPAQDHLVVPTFQPPLPLHSVAPIQEMPVRTASASASSDSAGGESGTPEPAYQAEQAKANALAALEALDAWEPI
jgi:hypothetical protein